MKKHTAAKKTSRKTGTRRTSTSLYLAPSTKQRLSLLSLLLDKTMSDTIEAGLLALQEKAAKENKISMSKSDKEILSTQLSELTKFETIRDKQRKHIEELEAENKEIKAAARKQGVYWNPARGKFLEVKRVFG